MRRWVPALAKKHGVTEATIRRDWPRRLGIDGWMLKLQAVSDVASLIGEQLGSIKHKIEKLEDNFVTSKSVAFQNAISAELRQLRAEHRGMMGILPLVQPTLILTPDTEEITARLKGSEFFEIMHSVSPRLTIEWIEAANRMPESLEAELAAERKELGLEEFR